MVRLREYNETEYAAVVDGLLAGKSFRNVAAENGMSLGMVQRIWAVYLSYVRESECH